VEGIWTGVGNVNVIGYMQLTTYFLTLIVIYRR
jgi:hypothetical protein